MYKFTAAVILLFSAMSLSTSIAADWSSGLQGGGTVTVDPDTRRATITRDGVSSPLWNGVHRLQDGSAMIVNDGEVVTGASVDRPRQLPPPEPSDWEGMPIAGYSPCEQLSHRVCGLHKECATAESCNLAQQLLSMERDERSKAEDGSRMTYTSGQCVKARQDDVYFAQCGHAAKQK
jgi:hypothetical protein